MSTNPEMRKRILIVDDNSANLELLVQTLTADGYDVRPAPNGKLALRYLENNHADLILLDIRMPGMDGYEVCERLMSNPNTASIPIVFLSAMEDDVNPAHITELGALTLLKKPIDVNALPDLIASFLDL